MDGILTSLYGKSNKSPANLNLHMHSQKYASAVICMIMVTISISVSDIATNHPPSLLAVDSNGVPMQFTHGMSRPPIPANCVSLRPPSLAQWFVNVRTDCARG